MASGSVTVPRHMDRWLDLVNRSFATSEELVSWAAGAGFGHLGLQGGEEALVLADRVGAACRELAAALCEGRRPAAEMGGLDRVVATVPGRMRVGPAGVAFEAELPPLAQVPLRLALEAAHFALDGRRPRLARCQRVDPACTRFFIDRSRDGRGRWCGPACGSVERVRRLRKGGIPEPPHSQAAGA